VLITSNVDDRCVLVEHTGSNPSALNGVPLNAGEKRKAGHDDIIEVLESSHFFKIEFAPKRKGSVEVPVKVSRTAENPASTSRSASNVTTMNGSLEHFLKDSALKSTCSWKSVENDRMLVFTSDESESKTKVNTVLTLGYEPRVSIFS
jgi:hypothetical protein